jgi:hypothetical protein
MNLEVMPQPGDEERAAIEAALVQAQEKRSSAWADALLPARSSELDP